MEKRFAILVGGERIEAAEAEEIVESDRIATECRKVEGSSTLKEENKWDYKLSS